ncbi:SLIT-ROBO Rho GTPase-activating 1-like [Paramuricea clavata]|uniref:SLIT-ROBO Rho GTPase-activating 1-like n=1 Tax=Paramuricea clavata TaxID=317549 RepID=A0A7D9EZA7_PARCT|nr:SLIT-ROBO Rho GTPase-activating 1-like [Paramuricea clavata]
MATKKDKALQDFESQYREVHKQLGEQLKSYDARTESKLSVLADYQEFYKRLGEVELEYARNLDKVAERFQDKLRQKLQRKDKMNTVDIFSRILQDLKSRAKIRSFMASRVSENMANRFATIIEDVQRVNKKCRETSVTLQEEFMKQLNDLNERVRRYHMMQTDSKLAESKLKSAESAQQKLQAPRKRASVKRAKNADKLREKCHKRYTETKLKAMRARNEYILSLEATNAFVKKYFDQDIYDILECYDHNYQQAFQRAMDYYAGMEIQASKMLQKDLTTLKDNVKGMNAESERLRIASDNPHTFQFTGKFVFINHSDDEVCQITAQEHDTLDKQHSDVEERLKTAKSETEEINKSLEAAKDTLRNTYNKLDQELSAGFSNEKGGSGGIESSATKSNREELENYHLAKFKELIMTSSVRTRLQAKHTALMKALGGEPGKRPPQLPMKPNAKTQALIANAHKKYQLFGSKLEDYVKVTGRPVPEIVESCVRFITKFGMDHQGIFRVPGSSTEINDMKEAFENGRDPLAGLNHWKDINAVAGVLRCYFRELEDPLFPRAYYQEFIEASRIFDSDEQARALNHVIKKLPDAVVVVMKYLFKFLFA